MAASIRTKLDCCLLILALAQVAAMASDEIDLAGTWRFALNRQDEGIAARWFNTHLNQRIKLPGSLPEQGIGDDIAVQTPWTGGIVDHSFFDSPSYAKYREPGHVRVPFWLQPEKYYKGAAWYQRDVQIPKAWSGKRIVLSLERPHWETRVWVDDRLVGTNNSLSTPHEYDLGQLAPGKHALSIRVDNRMIIDIGENSHAISDHTQGNWNGIVGKIALRATPLVWIEDVQVFPDSAKKTARVEVTVGSQLPKPVRIELSLYPHAYNVTSAPAIMALPVETSIAPGGGRIETELSFGDAFCLWDEFAPIYYGLGVRIEQSDDRTVFDNKNDILFGVRDFRTQGTQFVMNGRKTFIRGTLECCIFPKTGHPPTDLEEWMRVIRIAKAYGLNLLRFHSYCPPEAAFEAGDKLGMYFQVETCWANQSTTIGDGKPVDQWVYDETSRILKAYGNHPSFLLMPYGNEPGGKQAAAYLARYVEHFKSVDPRRLWTSGSGWPQLPENQFHVTPDPRIQAWGEGLKSRINAKPPETTTDYRAYIGARKVPVISHEIGQWCVYPDFDEISKYTGYLKPRNFEIFRDTLQSNGLGELARRFLLASGKLQTLCYKEDIESALRTPGMGGFELLDLHDFPGQGTALVGVLNPFWGDKGYVTAKEYSRFCNCTVPLARLSKRVFSVDETLTASLEVANFGSQPIENAVTEWKVLAGKGPIAQGKLPAKTIPIDNGIPLGDIAVDLSRVPAPARCRLVVSVAGFENDWDVWVYPHHNSVQSLSPVDVMVTDHLDDTMRARLAEGGKVLWTIPGKLVRNFATAPTKLGFSSIFWNTAWTGRQAPTTLGLLCDPKHPALAEFPTDDHTDWQWWYLIHRAGALQLDFLRGKAAPIVRVIDDWVTARSLALIAEAKVGKGKVIVCGFDLTDGADDPVSRQMRTSLLRYMGSERFDPRNELTIEDLQALIASPGQKSQRDIASIKADSEQEGYEAANALDGDPESMWHTSWDEGAPGFPHELVIEFEEPRIIAGFTALPRQDGNQNGWIKDFTFYLSQDGQNWGQPAAQGLFSRDARLKTVKLAAPTKAKFAKLVAVSGYANGPWASLAEFHLLPETGE